MQLQTGLYHQLITTVLEEKLNALPEDQYYWESVPLDKAEAASVLAKYLEEVIQFALKEFSQKHDGIEHQVRFCNDLIMQVQALSPIERDYDLPKIRGKLLIGILSKIGKIDQQLKRDLEQKLPKSGLITSTLFTGSQSDLSLDSEIERDILSADRIRWVVSFIRWSGIRIFEEALRKYCNRDGADFRVITTSYMSATEAKALAFLGNLPNTKVKISYQSDIQRLHAKAYLFERNSGADTAYIGSSNLSKAALTKGLEWNLRVTARENPQVLRKSKATFEYYWNSPDFEDFSEGGIKKFQSVLAQQSSRLDHQNRFQQFHIRPFQKEILNKLQTERETHGRNKNLLVAATGTGKTVISAFDYLRFSRKKNGKARLLFIAHRKEILKQARITFRSVLGRDYHDFGQLWVGEHQPEYGNLDHLFISIQTFNSNRDELTRRLPAEYYDFIVIDEAHHSQANTYRTIFEHFRPSVLLGLTATPERMDGLSLEPDFCNRIAAEIRLPDALNMGLLAPFQYFCITDDSVDLRSVNWNAGRYDIVDLGTKLSNVRRVGIIVDAIQHYLTTPQACRALCFCATQEHARYMSGEMNKAGLCADFLIGNHDRDHREGVRTRLREGTLNFLCVVDLFNEGVDIPEIDTVLFFRPTESLTVFLQQLGRGLRLAPDKEYLTVLDFVNHPHQNYNFDRKFRGLIGRTRQNMKEEIRQGFPHAPSGCTIRLEQQARAYILESIKNAVVSIQRLRALISSFGHDTTKDLCISNFLEFYELDIQILYKQNRYWSGLKKDAKLVNFEIDEQHNAIARGLRRLIHIDSPTYLSFINKLLSNDFELPEELGSDTFALMFYYDIWQKGISNFGFQSVREGIKAISNDEVLVQEIKEIVDHLQQSLDHTVKAAEFDFPCVLELHACYSRSQILCAFGLTNPERPFHSQEGVVQVPAHNAELLLVTLNKSDKDFSPSTLYDDYAISETLFHWQSQNRTGPDTPTGRAYLEQRRTRKPILLFTRDGKRDRHGFTSPYVFLGLVDFRSSEGERPMSIEWELREPMPPSVWRVAAKAAV